MPMGDDERGNFAPFPAGSKGVAGRAAGRDSIPTTAARKDEQFAGALKDKELVIFRESPAQRGAIDVREIGEKYDISRERVRQIEERVKRKLKAFLSKELKDIKSPAA